MRTDSRKVLAALALFLAGATVRAAPQDASKENAGISGDAVRLTVEVSWGIPQQVDELAGGSNRGDVAGSKPEYALELSQGRVVEAVAWPAAEPASSGGAAIATRAPAMRPGIGGSWRLGTEPSGQIRARLEVPLNASLLFRRGDQTVSIPVAAVLERPQRTPAQAPLAVNVERLGWDSLAIDLSGSASDGIVAPAADVPVVVAYNVLWPDCADVNVHATAVLRSTKGGDVLWRDEQNLSIPTNRREPAAQTWTVRAPRAEGTYELEVRATWDAAGVRDSSRLGRLIRAENPRPCRPRRPAGWSSASSIPSRDRPDGPVVLLGVMDMPVKPKWTRSIWLDCEVIGCWRQVDHRLRRVRPSWAIPSVALVESSRREMLRGWIKRSGTEAAKFDPADKSGLAWSAVGLKVAHPERPHRLSLKVKGGEPACARCRLDRARR